MRQHQRRQSGIKLYLGSNTLHTSFDITSHLEKFPSPVTSVADQPQVREGPLRGPHLVLNLAQLIANGNQKLAIALSLVRR